MKIYAKQVPPEQQQSPVEFYGIPKGIILYGNRYFAGNKDFENLENNIYNAADELEALKEGRRAGYSFREILRDFVPCDLGGRDYTRAERLKWRELLENYSGGRLYNWEAVCAALELITGDKHDREIIRGCCQGDWQYIIYPTKYGAEFLRDFEIEYFNTGAEWHIAEGDPENDDNYYIYTHAWRDDDIRAEIADVAGANADDVILYMFDGYAKTANYKLV